MKMFWIITILTIPANFELVRESYWFIKLNRADDHKGSTWLRILMCLLISRLVSLEMFDPPTGIWWFWLQCFWFSLCAYAFFDIRLNAIRMKFGGLDHKNVKLIYYGNSWTDNILKQLKPWQDISLRIVVLASGIAILFIR